MALQTGVGINVHEFTVDPGVRHPRLSLFDEFTDGNDDLDLYLFDPDGRNVDASGGGSSEEQVDVANPAAGEWTIVAHGCQTDGPDASYTLFRWALGDDAAGNLTVDDPGDATLGASATVNVAWTGLEAGNRYLGSGCYSDGTDEIGQTFTSITA